MNPHPQLLKLAAKVPMRLMRFKFVQKGLYTNEATLWMYGPDEEHRYCEISIEYAKTPLESQTLGSTLSLEKFLRCLVKGSSMGGGLSSSSMWGS